MAAKKPNPFAAKAAPAKGAFPGAAPPFGGKAMPKAPAAPKPPKPPAPPARKTMPMPKRGKKGC